MKVSLLIPCYNEEKSIEATVRSCLKQTRPFDELIFVDDCSKDRTPEILRRYEDKITVVRTPKNTGNKSSAQEYGLQFVTGEVFVTTDGDTILHPDFSKEIVKTFEETNTTAVVGLVKSLPYNWLTLCRAFEYSISQNIHKRAQSYLRYIFVMPGAASAFQTEAFKTYITFDHDTITEDLDFTYKLHKNNLSIDFNPKAICYTQDPATVHDYINQMRRWFGGGWQNLLKHYTILGTLPIRAFELSLVYTEGVVFSILLLILPFLNIVLWSHLLVAYFITTFILAIIAATFERRPGLLLVPVPYLLIMYINAFVYLEQFIKEIILRKKTLSWFKPERVEIKTLL